MALLVLLISSSLLVVWGVLTNVEERRGRRLFLGGLRTGLDNSFASVHKYLLKKIRHVSRYQIILNLYYGLHTVLKSCLRFVAHFYFLLEKRMENNRERVKNLRREKRQAEIINPTSKLDHLAVHKENSQLTDREKRHLKRKSLQDH